MPHKQAEHSDLAKNRASLTRFAWLSIAAAVVTITLKSGAYLLTDSVGLLSDALESLVNLAGAVMALLMLSIAARPPDESHGYGHSKAEYFASATEGILVLGAAIGIISAAINRLLQPSGIGQLGLGLGVSVTASAINLIVARVLLREGQARRSITLEADAHHLMTDVWTSAGVIGGVGIAGLTGWHILDPLVAIVVAVLKEGDIAALELSDAQLVGAEFFLVSGFFAMAIAVSSVFAWLGWRGPAEWAMRRLTG